MKTPSPALWIPFLALPGIATTYYVVTSIGDPISPDIVQHSPPDETNQSFNRGDAGDMCFFDAMDYSVASELFFIVPGTFVDVVHTTRNEHGDEIRTTFKEMLVVALPDGKPSCLALRTGERIPVPTVTLRVTVDQARLLGEKGSLVLVGRPDVLPVNHVQQ